MKIYKYTPYIDLVLENKALRISPMIELNDPFEALHHPKLQELQEQLLKKISIDSESEDGLRKMIDLGWSQHAVISLTTNKNHPLMWGHYTDSHKGGVLEFDVDYIDPDHTSECSFIKDLKHDFKFVTYSDKRDFEFKNENLSASSLSSIFSKSRAWSYENEIRISARFTSANFFLIPLKSLTEYYNTRSTEWFFDHITKGYFFDKNKKRHFLVYEVEEDDCFRYVKKEIDIVKEAQRVLGEEAQISIHSEDTLKVEYNSELNFFANYLKATRLTKSQLYIHPMISINPESLTGIYLGGRYNGNHNKWIENYPNLKGEIYKAQQDNNSYELNYIKEK